MRNGSRGRIAPGWLSLGVTAFLACGDPTASPVAPGLNAAAGSKSTTVTVTAADPSWGHEGTIGKQVVVTGTGFEPGAQASWQRNGVDDPKIHVQSTQYVNSTQLIATIDIAPDAVLTYYDVAVTNPNRKGGIGSLLFEVTQAYPISGAMRAFDVNDNGRVAGVDNAGRPYVYDISSGVMQAIGDSGFAGMAISQDGFTVTGSHNRSRDGDMAVTWTWGGSSWRQDSLPRDPAATGSGTNAITSDAAGSAHYIAGWEFLKGGKGKTAYSYMVPRLWIRTTGGWNRLSLPPNPAAALPRGVAWDVAPNGVVAGEVDLQAAVWDPDGAGGYVLTVLLNRESRLQGVNDAGTLVVGLDQVNGTNVYWQRAGVGSPWTGPLLMPAGCGDRAVDNLSRTVGICPTGPSTSQAALILPPLPWASTGIRFLGGLGKSAAGNPVSISPNGAWIVGSAGGSGSGTPGGALQAIYWRGF